MNEAHNFETSDEENLPRLTKNEIILPQQETPKLTFNLNNLHDRRYQSIEVDHLDASPGHETPSQKTLHIL